MTCKDCIHYDVCKRIQFPSMYGLTGDGCDHFKNKANIIELPCKAGDVVYVIEPLWYGIWGEDEHKCRKCEHFYEGGMGDSPDCNLGKNCCYQICENEADLRDIVDWITPSHFTKTVAWGKTVFLTREEAEQKLGGAKE